MNTSTGTEQNRRKAEANPSLSRKRTYIPYWIGTGVMIDRRPTMTRGNWEWNGTHSFSEKINTKFSENCVKRKIFRENNVKNCDKNFGKKREKFFFPTWKTEKMNEKEEKKLTEFWSMTFIIAFLWSFSLVLPLNFICDWCWTLLTGFFSGF